MSKLKLMALDNEDLQVISGCCQDSVLKVGDLQYLAGEQRFMLALNRFAWEQEKGRGEPDERDRKSVV